MHSPLSIVSKYPFLPVQRYEVIRHYCHKESMPDKWNDTLSTLSTMYHTSLAELLQHDLVNGHSMDDPQIRIFLNTDFNALSNGQASVKTNHEILNEGQKKQVVDGIHQDTTKRISTVSKKLNVTGPNVPPNAPSVADVLSPERVMQMYCSSTPHLLHALLAEDRRSHLSKRAAEKRNGFSLFRNIVDSGLVQRIHKDDLHELLHLCLALTSTNPPTLECTVAFGATEAEPTLRLPSYLIGAIDLMRTFQKHQNAGALSAMPKLRVYFGTSLGYSVNKIGKDIAEMRERQMSVVLMRFLADYAPDVQQHVHVANDQGMEHINEQVAIERFSLVDQRFSDMQGMQRDIDRKISEGKPSDDDLYDDVIAQAVRMVGKNMIFKDTAAIGVMRYAGSHPDFFGDIVHEGSGNTPPDFILSLGGRGEEFFNNCRREIARCLQKIGDSVYCPHAIRIVQPIGKDPPYYNREKVDPAIGSNTVEPSFTDGTASETLKSIRGDYEQLHGFLRRYLAQQLGIKPKEVSAAMVQEEMRRFSLVAEEEMRGA